tara:strand:- start:9620 stop:10282 length:663 start_codon:yes stop_codon:yes gene_type:complete
MDKHLEIIKGEQEVHHGINRDLLTIDQHLAKEWNSDIGKPMCIYNIKKIIVKMRRKQNDALSGVEFEEYLTEYQEEILSNCNQRWLLSIVDTIADYGQGERCVNATWLGTHYKMTLLTDSLFHHATNWKYNRNNITTEMPIIPDGSPGQRLYAISKPFPGLKGEYTQTNVETDIVQNIAIRLNRAFADDHLIADISNRLHNMYTQSDSIYGLWETLKYEG